MSSSKTPSRLERLPFVLLLVLAACSESHPRPNVVLLSIDTLRADHVGSYGYERDTTPRLDRFAAGAVRYARAQTPAPWTLPSHVALLTGRHPHDIGIRHYESVVPAEVTPFAELLAQAGYQSAGFVDSGPGGFVGEKRGLARGFDTYEHAPFEADALYRYDIRATVDRAAQWLAERDRERPFFLFLHTKSVHTTPADPPLIAESDAPYHKPEPYRTRFLPAGETRFSWTDDEGNAGVHFLRATNGRIGAGVFDRASFTPERIEELIALYDGGIYYTDEQVGRLLDLLEQEGVADETLVIVTADHGEAFLEHDLVLHKEVYESQLAIPLLVRYPRWVDARGVVSTPVSLMDVAPTVLAQVGLPIPADVTGRPLPLEDEPGGDERPLFGAFEYEEGYFYRAASLREGPWKLVVRWLGVDAEPVAALYDLRTDPGETRPVTGEPERLEDMLRRTLARYHGAVSVGGAAGERLELDAAAEEDLRALGYMGEER